MIVSHRLKFGYLRAPKTGTSTAEFMLRMTDVFTEDDYASSVPRLGNFPSLSVPDPFKLRLQGREKEANEAVIFGPHMFLHQLIEKKILTEEQLADYDVYAYLRDPYKRFISGVGHAYGDKILPDLVFDTALAMPERYDKSALFWRQADYFKYDGEVATTPLDFRKYQQELRMLIDRIGGQQPPIIPRMNAQGHVAKQDYEDGDFWTDKTILSIEETYAEDFEIYEQFFGKPERPVPTGNYE